MRGLDGILQALELTPIDNGGYTAPNTPGTQGMIFGGQLLAQTIVAAARTHPDKPVKTVHILFARAGRPDNGVEIDVTDIHTGRSVAGCTVSIHQGDRVCTSATVLCTSAEPDFIHHAAAMPEVQDPETARALHHLDGWDIRICGDVDIDDPEAVGPPDLRVWTRFPAAPPDLGMDQPLLGYATDGFLIGTAMRPHAGVGQAQAHVSITTGVLSHTLTFHEPFTVRDWLLFDQHAPHAGAGRSYGTGSVFTTDGRLVASFVQDAMIRPMEPTP